MLYLDASAIVKLVRREPETSALMVEIEADPERVSSALAWTEVVRAARRARAGADRAQAVLEGIGLVPVDDGILRGAGELTPTTPRILDAIHLATALSLRDDLTAVLAYDDRLIAAARRHGLRVCSPGR
ncbi:MAG: type II toxin-antitoxin system VapC family toxin [Actinomycetota bacterium]